MRTTLGVPVILTLIALAVAPQPVEGQPARQPQPARIDVVARDEPLDKLLRRVAAGNRHRVWFDERAIKSAGLRLE